MKKISIIIPNYNNGKFIGECLNSIYKQTIRNEIEVIVIDDGSTDDSVEVIKKFMNDHSDISVKLIEQYNQNAAIARNQGLKIASGEYIYFIDSDDSLYDEYVLEKMFNDIKQSDLLLGNFVIVDEKTKHLQDYNFIKDIDNEMENQYKYLLIKPCPANKLYKHSIIKNNNIYFDNINIAQDLNFYIKYLMNCSNIKEVKYNIFKYRIVSNSMTRTINFNIFDIVKCFNKIEKYYDINNKSEDYLKYVTIAELNHYNSQLNKSLIIEKKSLRNLIYKYFMYNIKLIDYCKVCTTKRYKYEMKKYRFKKYFKILYYSKLFKSIRSKKKQKSK